MRPAMTSGNSRQKGSLVSDLFWIIPVGWLLCAVVITFFMGRADVPFNHSVAFALFGPFGLLLLLLDWIHTLGERKPNK